MKALVVDAGGAGVREVVRPRLRPHEARVRVRCSGICNTDFELVRGYHDFSGILGHEFVGIVDGPAGSPRLGRRVVGEINVGCNRCAWCRQNLSRHCPRRTVIGIKNRPGAHAEWLTVPERNLFVVPDGMPDEVAVFVEPLAAACEILEQVSVTSKMRAAVLGAGKLGSLVAQVLRLSGAGVTVLGRGDEPRRAGFDLVVEATGSPLGMTRALALVRPRGTVVWKSTHHLPARFDSAPLVVNEITVIGSRCGRFAPALALLANRQVDVTKLLSAELPLTEAPRALRLAARRGVKKVLLRP
ncbi:MAG: alcohol dehydrogenase catalytic domain-containing protein [Thermoanaerobaculia bacterium]